MPDPEEKWDFLRCRMAVAGVNSPWTLTDIVSVKLPYVQDIGATDANMFEDDLKNDWYERVQANTGYYASDHTDASPHTVFECSTQRAFDTGDTAEDYNIHKGRTPAFFHYGIYDSTDIEITRGYKEYVEFIFPLTRAVTVKVSMAIAAFSILVMSLI